MRSDKSKAQRYLNRYMILHDGMGTAEHNEEQGMAEMAPGKAITKAHGPYKAIIHKDKT